MNLNLLLSTAAQTHLYFWYAIFRTLVHSIQSLKILRSLWIWRWSEKSIIFKKPTKTLVLINCMALSLSSFSYRTKHGSKYSSVQSTWKGCWSSRQESQHSSLKGHSTHICVETLKEIPWHFETVWSITLSRPINQSKVIEQRWPKSGHKLEMAQDGDVPLHWIGDHLLSVDLLWDLVHEFTDRVCPTLCASHNCIVTDLGLITASSVVLQEAYCLTTDCSISDLCIYCMKHFSNRADQWSERHNLRSLSCIASSGSLFLIYTIFFPTVYPSDIAITLSHMPQSHYFPPYDLILRNSQWSLLHHVPSMESKVKKPSAASLWLTNPKIRQLSWSKVYPWVYHFAWMKQVPHPREEE